MTLTDQQNEAVLESLGMVNPEALTPDGFERAVIGYCSRGRGGPVVAVVSVQDAIEILMLRDEISYDSAREYLEFNSIGAWVGPMTPIWMDGPDQ